MFDSVMLGSFSLVWAVNCFDDTMVGPLGFRRAAEPVNLAQEKEKGLPSWPHTDAGISYGRNNAALTLPSG